MSYEDIDGLSPNENRELRGVLDPSNSILSESRTGDNEALELHADYFENAIEKTRDDAIIEENE